MLIAGIMIIANDQPRISAVESIFGGWAMLSPEYQELLQELMFGYALAVIGIILVIVAVIPSKIKQRKRHKLFRYSQRPLCQRRDNQRRV